jgi:uncharacterized protein (DUF58 family)
VPGDPYKRIHWRSTAHRSTAEREQLDVKEFDPEPLADVWLVLDLAAKVQVGRGLNSTEESAVTVAASLAQQLLRGQRRVGLAARGAQAVVIEPQRGEAQLWNLLGALAEARASGALPLDQVLARIEPSIHRGMSCAIITPSTDIRWPDALPPLLVRGIRPVALLVDGRPFGGSAGPEEVAARLAALGLASFVFGREVLPSLPPLVAGEPAAQGAGERRQP